jgi:acyl-CoA hydrolase
MSDYEAIAERLAAIEEELRDLAFERLKTAAGAQEDEDEFGRAAREEKRLLQARRAIAKAINALRAGED